MSNEQRVSLEGTHKAKAIDFQFGASNGKEQVALMFRIIGGEHDGKTISWFGFFTEKTAERTLESLRACGWYSDDIAALEGVTDNEVEIVVKDETYDGKTRSKVQWVNRASRLNLKNQLDGNQLKAFAARMKGMAVASRQKVGVSTPAPAQRPQAARPQESRQRQPGDDDGDYGADAPYADSDVEF